MRTSASVVRAAILLAAIVTGVSVWAAGNEVAGQKSEGFDRDPGWEGWNNHVVPGRATKVTQDFGYAAARVAADGGGEVGGRVTRAGRPAYYAERLGAGATLDEKLTASGTFALSGSEGGSGVFFGWFKAGQAEGGGRPVNSLGFHFDGERGGGRLAVRLIGATNQACGTFVTPFVPGKYRPTPIRNDGTRYAWTLEYDPDAHHGDGQFRCTVSSNGKTSEEFEGKVFTVDLPPGLRRSGATFDHFGLMNGTKPGGVMTIHFADLRRGGRAVELGRDPGWEGSGNRTSYEERLRAGAHDFGYSAKTQFAGGKAAGEVGGDLWRSGPYAYYADRVGPLDLGGRLEAHGRVMLAVGAPDSDVFLGWFGGEQGDKSPVAAGNFVGVHVGGPTRVGHYFAPAVTTGKGTRARAEKGPVLVPGRAYEWSLVYDPAAANGDGSVTVRLGEESVVLTLKPGVKGQGARLDRFGLFTSNIGGQLVRIYLDDLTYTASPKGSQ